MINQLEVPMYVEEALPEMAHGLLIVNRKNTPYDVMNSLTEFTNKNIKEHNYRTVKRCFTVADRLYCKGNSAVKNAVENVFVFSFTSMLSANAGDKKKLLAIIPITLYSLYMGQLYRSGC
jgi:hypothetical protein